MTDDIEHLKTTKLEPASDGKKLLPTVSDASTAEQLGDVVVRAAHAPEQPVSPTELRAHIVAALKTVYDPEIPLNIYDLGLIYSFDVDDTGDVRLEMTLTAPGCPVAGELVHQVAQRVAAVDGVREARVRLTWDPPWTKDRLTEEALLELGLL